MIVTRHLFDDTAAADVCRQAVARDAESTELTPAFRTYYRLRCWVPLVLRQYLQRRRPVAAGQDWFLPTEFMRSIAAALADESDETTLIHPWPEGRRFALVLTHDVESAEGLRHALALADIEQEFGFRSSWNIVPYRYPVDEGIVRELRQRGHEIGVHGFNHDGRLYASLREFDRRAPGINGAIERFAAEGFRSPMVHRNLEWLQALDVSYDASCFDVDPYQAMPGGVGTIWPFFAGRFVELPYTLPQDHTLLVVLGEQSDRIWRKKLDFLLRHQGMALMLTHPDYLNTPRRRDLYRGFLDHLAHERDYWNALPREMARWWRERDASSVHSDEQGRSVVVGPAAERAVVARLGVTDQCLNFAPLRSAAAPVLDADVARAHVG